MPSLTFEDDSMVGRVRQSKEMVAPFTSRSLREETTVAGRKKYTQHADMPQSNKKRLYTICQGLLAAYYRDV